MLDHEKNRSINSFLLLSIENYGQPLSSVSQIGTTSKTK